MCVNSGGNVVINWTCQYDGVKSIDVLRSVDKDFNYSEIGKVKNLKRGAQQYIDSTPQQGDNYYKLLITFKSGLNWHSDHGQVQVTATKKTTPVSGMYAKPNVVKNEVKPLHEVQKKDSIKMASKSGAVNPELPTNKTRAGAELGINNGKVNASGVQTVITSNKTGVLNKTSTGKLDSNLTHTHKHFSLPVTHDTDADPVCQITSKYVFVDTNTGQVNIEIKDELKIHHYSVKFYDRSHTAVLDIPRINVEKIIFDKRNFRQKGTYKFVLRKDNLEWDSGFIVIH